MAMSMRNGLTSTAATALAVPRARRRRAGCGRVRGRIRRRGRNHGPVAGRAPMTAIRLGLGRSGRVGAAAGGGERGRSLELEPFLDLDGRDLVAHPVGLLARGMQPALAEVALAGRVHAAPARLVAGTSLAHRCPPPARLRELLGDAQLRAPRAAVPPDLIGARGDDALGDRAQLRPVAAGTDRRLRILDAVATLARDEPLDDPVLEAVVADDRHAAR